ncbi:MAG: hypothetical protein PHV74_06660, partial [Dehalococcoidia bacterium]|nr:hypothetical protein [Dehalococcoidia bacterium]
NLPTKVATSPLAVERALELLTGPGGDPSGWFYLQELSCMKVEHEESIRRVTVHQENDITRRGVVFRKDRLQRAQDAMTLPGHGVPWPVPVQDMEGGFQFEWNSANPHRNVVSMSTGASATLVFLGDQSDDAIVESVHQKVLQTLMCQAAAEIGSGADPTDAVIRATDRFCVVYRRDHIPCVWSPEGIGRFDKPLKHSAVDIAGGEG